MAKRFTDSRKWFDPWFRKLPAPYREFWIYLCDTCNHAGIWKVDEELASFYLGQSIDLRRALEVFGDRVWLLGEDKWFLPKFISFQYGTLSYAQESNRARASVISLLKEEGLWDKSKGLVRPIDCYKDKSKDKDKDKDKEKEKEKEKETVKDKVKEKRKEEIEFIESYQDFKELKDSLKVPYTS